MVMKNIFIYIVLLAAFAQLNAQRLEIKRTDVDASRKDKITATYLFGFDVYAEDIQDCNGVAFELQFDQTQYIKFSGWQNGDFGKYGKPQVVRGKTQEGKGRLIVGVGSGLSADTSGIENPKVITLEFAVLQSAPHFETVTMEFVQPKATVFQDSAASMIDLETEPVNFTIHSFIDVYPGDANNDGTVNHLDYNTINLYMGKGSSTKNLRSFKRPEASTIWKPQRVLAWDSAAMTYADCDGNADITETDHLIVTYNMDRNVDEEGGTIQNTRKTNLKANKFKQNILQSSAESKPLNISSSDEFIAAAGAVNLGKNKLKSVTKGKIIGENGFLFYNVDEDNILHFATGSLDKTSYPANGQLINIHTDEKTGDLKIKNLKAINRNGFIYDLKTTTSVKQKLQNKELTFKDGSLTIPAKMTFPLKVQIVGLKGSLIEEHTKHNPGTLDLNHLTTGIYFVIIESGNTSTYKKITVR